MSEISGLEQALMKQFPHGATKEEVGNFLKLLKRRESYREELLNMAAQLAESGLDANDGNSSAESQSDADESVSLKKTISRTIRTSSGKSEEVESTPSSAPEEAEEADAAVETE
jgi:hypothetical protein